MTTRKHPAKFAAFPPEWIALIHPCEDKQKALRTSRALSRDWSDAEFVKGSSMPSSSWNMLQSGAYPVPKSQAGIDRTTANLKNLLQRCADIDAEIQDAARRANQMDVKGRYIPTKDYEAIKRAIGEAATKVAARSEERCIFFIADTRCGKTWTKQVLIEEKLVNWSLSGRPSWKHSYTAVLIEFARILNVDYPRRAAARSIEAEVILKARSMSGVLWIEEIQSLCKQGQEFVKLLLNETTLTIVISLTRGAYITLKDTGGDEGSQLLARAEMTLWAAKISADWITLYDPALWSRSHQPGHREEIARVANERGGYSAVRDICQTITRLVGPGTVITDQHVTDAITLYRLAVPLIKSRAPSRTEQSRLKAA